MTGLKTCTKCDAQKGLSEFYTRHQGASYLPRCKECTREYQREFQKKRRLGKNEYQAGYRSLNRDKIRERNREYYHANKARLSVKKKWNRILSKYNLTREEFDVLFEDQNGLCKICKEPMTLCVDHDHKTGKVRGLLCHDCNRFIGLARESKENLQRAILYLSKEESS